MEGSSWPTILLPNAAFSYGDATSAQKTLLRAQRWLVEPPPQAAVEAAGARPMPQNISVVKKVSIPPARTALIRPPPLFIIRNRSHCPARALQLQMGVWTEANRVHVRHAGSMGRRIALLEFAVAAPSSSGLGHRPFKAKIAG